MYTCQLYRRWIRQPPQPFCSHKRKALKNVMIVIENETKVNNVKTCAISASLLCPWCRGSCAAAGWCCSPISPTKTSREPNIHKWIISENKNVRNTVDPKEDKRQAILKPSKGGKFTHLLFYWFSWESWGRLQKGVGTDGWAQKNRLSVNRCNSRMMTHKQAYELLLL